MQFKLSLNQKLQVKNSCYLCIIIFTILCHNFAIAAAQDYSNSQTNQMCFKSGVGIGQFYVEDDDEFGQALNLSLDFLSSKNFGVGIDLLYAGTSNEISPFDDGALLSKVWPYAQYFFKPTEELSFKFKLGIGYSGIAIGDDIYVEGSGLGLRLGGDSRFVFSKNSENTIAGLCSLSIGFLSGESEPHGYYEYSEDDEFFDTSFIIGVEYALKKAHIFSLSYNYENFESDEFDKEIGWTGLMFNYIHRW